MKPAKQGCSPRRRKGVEGGSQNKVAQGLTQARDVSGFSGHCWEFVVRAVTLWLRGYKGFESRDRGQG